MSVQHHPSQELLLGHAAGTRAGGPALLMHVHLRACAACSAEVARLECIGGALLDEQPPASMAPDALARTLARLDSPPEPPPARQPQGIDLAGALDGLRLGPRRWLGPGMWMRPVLGEAPERTYLLRSGPGRRLPRHTHVGTELVCVLKGAFSDETGRYGPGDFAESDERLAHAPVTDDDGECLCLIAAEGPMRFEGALFRALQPLFGV